MMDVQINQWYLSKEMDDKETPELQSSVANGGGGATVGRCWIVTGDFF